MLCGIKWSHAETINATHHLYKTRLITNGECFLTRLCVSHSWRAKHADAHIERGANAHIEGGADAHIDDAHIEGGTDAHNEEGAGAHIGGGQGLLVATGL